MDNAGLQGDSCPVKVICKKCQTIPERVTQVYDPAWARLEIKAFCHGNEESFHVTKKDLLLAISPIRYVFGDAR
jgi:hypothetical protein